MQGYNQEGSSAGRFAGLQQVKKALRLHGTSPCTLQAVTLPWHWGPGLVRLSTSFAVYSLPVAIPSKGSRPLGHTQSEPTVPGQDTAWREVLCSTTDPQCPWSSLKAPALGQQPPLWVLPCLELQPTLGSRISMSQSLYSWLQPQNLHCPYWQLSGNGNILLSTQKLPVSRIYCTYMLITTRRTGESLAGGSLVSAQKERWRP